MDTLLGRKLVAKAIQKSYSCCIYLHDNTCDPDDDECISIYFEQNRKFQFFSLIGFASVLVLIVIASIINGCIQRIKKKETLKPQ